MFRKIFRNSNDTIVFTRQKSRRYDTNFTFTLIGKKRPFFNIVLCMKNLCHFTNLKSPECLPARRRRTLSLITKSSIVSCSLSGKYAGCDMFRTKLLIMMNKLQIKLILKVVMQLISVLTR